MTILNNPATVPFPPALAAPLGVQAGGIPHRDDESLVSRVVVAMTALQRVAQKWADLADDCQREEALSGEYLAGCIVGHFAPLLPASREAMDAALLEMGWPPAEGVVAAVPAAENEERAYRGAYRCILLAGTEILDRLWSSHEKCPGCELCRCAAGQTSALELLRSCSAEYGYVHHRRGVDLEVFGVDLLESIETGIDVEDRAREMSDEQLQAICIRFGKVAAA